MCVCVCDQGHKEGLHSFGKEAFGNVTYYCEDRFILICEFVFLVDIYRCLRTTFCLQHQAFSLLSTTSQNTVICFKRMF
jgi:hypothetical protein